MAFAEASMEFLQQESQAGGASISLTCSTSDEALAASLQRERPERAEMAIAELSSPGKHK